MSCLRRWSGRQDRNRQAKTESNFGLSKGTKHFEIRKTMNLEQQVESFRTSYAALRSEIGKVIVGHEEIVDGTLITLFGAGNLLLEGVPGLGKTLLVRTLSQVLDLSFSRIQFSPALMPADIIGTNIVMETPEGRKQFEFQ